MVDVVGGCAVQQGGGRDGKRRKLGRPVDVKAHGKWRGYRAASEDASMYKPLRNREFLKPLHREFFGTPPWRIFRNPSIYNPRTETDNGNARAYNASCQ